MIVRRIDVAAALIYDESREKVLMVRNQTGDSSYWSLPGGAVESGETLEEAVKREAKEETGLEVAMISLHSLREVFFAGNQHHAFLFTFEAKIIGGEINVSDPDKEILDVQWVKINTANEIMSQLPVKLFLDPLNRNGISYSFHGTV
ncbi:NUDIX domain-containing protein [Paenibacillus sp. sgz500958]|uniref:NUDIX domain-containing protein n=1 Tax=Paenibacillus sp. sgz500958 TaxID=3242475 RepID=UPI0036D4260E